MIKPSWKIILTMDVSYSCYLHLIDEGKGKNMSSFSLSLSPFAKIKKNLL